MAHARRVQKLPETDMKIGASYVVNTGLRRGFVPCDMSRPTPDVKPVPRYAPERYVLQARPSSTQPPTVRHGGRLWRVDAVSSEDSEHGVCKMVTVLHLLACRVRLVFGLVFLEIEVQRRTFIHRLGWREETSSTSAMLLASHVGISSCPLLRCGSANRT